MHEDLKFVSLATTFEIDNSFDSDRFIKLRLRVQHDGENPNGSAFTIEDMSKAQESIKNIPILAHVLFDEDGNPQFGAHDMHIEESKTTEGEYKLIYDEQPLGCVPETNNYLISDFNGKNYVFVDSFVWRDYSNYGEEIIKRDTNIKLSMEIIVDAYQYDSKTKIYNITDYRYKGITLLGNNYGTGMLDALASTESFSDEGKQKLFNLMSELKEEISKNQSSLEVDIKTSFLNEKEEKINLNEKIELITKYGLTVELLGFSIDEISLEDLEVKLKEFSDNQNKPKHSYSATYNQKREAIRNALDSEIIRDADGNVVEETYYWVADASDEFAYVERSHWSANGDYDSKYGRFTYSFEEATMTATITSEFEEMFLMWLTAEQKAEIDSANANFEQLKADFDVYKENYSTPNSDVEKLREFQNTIIETERKDAEDAIFTQFDEKLANNEEYITLKSKVKDYDNLEDFTDKCFAILGKTTANFAIKTPEKKTVKISVDTTPVSDVLYGGLIEKYTGK